MIRGMSPTSHAEQWPTLEGPRGVPRPLFKFLFTRLSLRLWRAQSLFAYIVQSILILLVVLVETWKRATSRYIRVIGNAEIIDIVSTPLLQNYHCYSLPSRQAHHQCLPVQYPNGLSDFSLDISIYSFISCRESKLSSNISSTLLNTKRSI